MSDQGDPQDTKSRIQAKRGPGAENDNDNGKGDDDDEDEDEDEGRRCRGK
ncbi:hypothetical protein BDR05DRAFT_1007011 [Suillus weaverae]|nr:hypothetical protein BDR05DRAFT_1007011 [Suillus weaverae]